MVVFYIEDGCWKVFEVTSGRLNCTLAMAYTIRGETTPLIGSACSSIVFHLS